jgi:hypothetical protein
MVQLRRATPDDLEAVLPRVRALNADEGIEIDGPVLAAALRRLLADPGSAGAGSSSALAGRAVTRSGMRSPRSATTSSSAGATRT